MEYNSIPETAARWGISAQRVNRLCQEGRIDGAKKVGHTWIIPADAVKPPDARYKNKDKTVDGGSYGR